jgi:ankyrin repeat protein
MGDLELVKSLHTGSDPLTFFGRPSWAAAAQGHGDVVQFCFDRGALPYEPTDKGGPNFRLSRTPLGAAAYMGHEDIVRLYLQQDYYRSFSERSDAGLAAYFAAQGNQANTLRVILEHVQSNAKHHEFLGIVDWSLVCSCRRGALDAAKVALFEYGADVNETDLGPRSCLQLAVMSDNAQLVSLLLDAGAGLAAPNVIRQRSTGEVTPRRRQVDALLVAKKRGYATIVQMLEEKKRIVDAERDRQVA